VVSGDVGPRHHRFEASIVMSRSVPVAPRESTSALICPV
jgi:hypothetical protein